MFVSCVHKDCGSSVVSSAGCVVHVGMHGVGYVVGSCNLILNNILRMASVLYVECKSSAESVCHVGV